MRLLNPGPGECVDRLTILELKIKAAETRKLSAVHLKAEQNMIIAHLKDKFPDTDFCRTSLYLELKHTNEKLWKLEDEIRMVMLREYGTPPGQFDKEIAAVAVSIANMNDARSTFVEMINENFGITGREKFYMESNVR